MTDMGSIGPIIGWQPYQWPRLPQYWPTEGGWSEYRNAFSQTGGQPGDMYDWGPDLRRYVMGLNKQMQGILKGLSEAFPDTWPTFPSGGINIALPAPTPSATGGARRDSYKVRVAKEDLTPHFLYTDDDVDQSKMAEGEAIDLQETGGDGAYKWVTIVHGTPTIPADVDCDEIGVGSEGSEAADSSTWLVTGDPAKGALVTSQWRSGYFESGDETFYGYNRTMKFDRFGHFVGMVGETRATIDVPEICS